MKNRTPKCAVKIKFEFAAKSGKEHVVESKTAESPKIFRACQELPGQELFQYVGRCRQKQSSISGG